MVEPASVRLSRLIVPVAAAAAAATYVALMRDQKSGRRRRRDVQPSPPPAGESVSPVMQPPHIAVPAAFEPSDALPDLQPSRQETREMRAPAGGASSAAVGVSELSPPHVGPEDTTVVEPSAAPEVPHAAADPHEPDAYSSEVAVEGPVLDEGSFSLGGWAAAPGHTVVSAVTFHQRLAVEVAPERIVLSIEHAENVPDDGLVVLADPGFAPDREGFTLVLAAADPGPFSVSGTYRAIG